MSDSVKFIFKTLTKVPIIIMCAYAVFNIFAFFFIYFRMLGVSYVVMQTAVENNYIPTTEGGTLLDYLEDTDSISMVDTVGLVVAAGSSEAEVAYNGGTSAPEAYTKVEIPNGDGTSKWIGIVTPSNDPSMTNAARIGTVETGARRKHQYGTPVICGVYCRYKIIWPLDYRYTGNRDAITADNGATDNSLTSGSYNYNGVAGYDGTGETSRQSYMSAWSKIPLLITYKVPGLKYYPDMLFTE